MKLKIGEWLRKYIDKTLQPDDTMPMNFPPPISRTLGFEIVDIAPGVGVMEMQTDPAVHGNPMGTIHGGVLADIADAAIGCAHAATLEENESFTTVDLRINFFRPVWKEKIRASAKVVQLGKTISYYTCDVTRADGKLLATVTSSVITLRGEKSVGR